MAKHRISLLLSIVMAVIFFIVTMVFSALAAPGKCKLHFHGCCVSFFYAWTTI